MSDVERDQEIADVIRSVFAPDASPPRTQTVGEFAAVDEKGAEAILGNDDGPLMPEGGDVELYGDGGVGKTTLSYDLAFHLAAGDDWLGIPISKPRRVLIIEGEGPRPLLRKKIARKLAAWKGKPIGDRLRVFEHPWGSFTFAEAQWRLWLAQEIAGHEIDVVIVGPITSVGMDVGGTIPEVRAFIALVNEVRLRSGRAIATVLIHHENKGGQVSGAWEGVGDGLWHLQGQSHGRVRLYFQKSRWSSAMHATTLQLIWVEGDSFALAEADLSRPERTWTDIADYVLEHGGCAWNEVEHTVSGQGEYLRRRRNAMLEDGLIINTGKGQRFELWHRDDPARPTLDLAVSEDGRGWDAVVSAHGDRGEARTVSPRPLRSRDAGRDTVGSGSPPPPDVEADQ